MKIAKPKIATCMPSWEGGRFAGSEEERIRILEDSCGFADYVTLELNMEPHKRDAVIKKAKKMGVKVIIAYHNFKKTPSPPEIEKILASEKSCGADIAKITFMPESPEDVLTTSHALVENKDKIPLIAISMGELGKPSRILGPLLGSYLTYGHPPKKGSAAPGQFSVVELKKILGNLK